MEIIKSALKHVGRGLLVAFITYYLFSLPFNLWNRPLDAVSAVITATFVLAFLIGVCTSVILKKIDENKKD